MTETGNIFGLAAIDQLIATSWQSPAGPLARALGLADQRRIVGSSDRLDVTTTGRVWLVLSGSVELFLIDDHGRSAFLNIGAGNLIAAFEPQEGVRLAGIPAPDTEIVETTTLALNPLASDSQYAELLRTALANWRKALVLVAGPMIGGDSPPVAFDLERLAASVLERALLQRRERLARTAADRAMAERLAAHDLTRGLESMVDLIGVRSGHGRDDSIDTASAAAEAVLRAMGVTDLVTRADSDYSPRLSDVVEQVAQDNRLQVRAVKLHDHWWDDDLGPLLGSIDGKPCALIRSGKHYVLHGNDQPRPVDAKVAAAVAGAAYSFYLPFPGGELTAWRVLGFGIRAARRDIWAILLTLLLTGLFSLVMPIATGWLMDPIVPDAERGQVGVIAGLLLLVAIGTTAASVVQSLATLRLEALADNRVQAAVWLRLLNLQAPFFRDYTAGDLTSRADGINAIRKLVSQSFASFASSGISMLFGLALLFYYEWRLALAAIVISALFSTVVYFVGSRVLHYNFQSLDLGGKLQGTVLQLLGSIAKLRVAGAERYAFLRWLATYRESVALSLHQRILNNRIHILHVSFAPLVIVAVLIILGIHSGDLFAFFRLLNAPSDYMPLMSVPDFVSFNVALGQFIGAVLGATHAALMLVMMQPYFRRVTPIIAASEEPTGRGARIGAMAGEIELRDIRFRYNPSAPLALRGLSLTIPAGRFVAIVGPSGAGKSSIVRLLLNFETPESGEIYIDGTDIRLLDPQDLRRHYGVVLQNGLTLAGSIYDNVSAGLPLSTDEVMEALRLAALDDVVKALPMGLHTNMAEGAITFSGGQRQRLMIARALIRRPRILILDEATSALDNITQSRVAENLRALDCTQVVIAQRLSTIMAADLIYVVDEGQVVESGTYLELLENGGLFKQLVERQLL